MKKVVILFVGWLVLVNAFALIALNRVNLEPDTAYTWINSQEVRQEQGWNPVPLHVRWDSFWYLDIAQHGYSLSEENTLANIVFFPLYPLLMRILSFALGGNLVLAGWLISSLALFGALAYLWKLAKEFHPEIGNKYLPLLLLLAFPTAFFLNAVYTESLFLFLSIASLYYGMRGEWGKAGLLGGAAALTRVTGVLLLIPLLWEYGKRFGFRARSLFRPSILPIAAIPSAALGFFAFHWYRFNDPFLFFRIESAWGRAFTLNQEHFAFPTNPALANFALDVLFVLFAVGATVLVFWKLRASYGLYMAATLAIALSTGTLMSIGRYILVLFPIFLLGALVKNEYGRSLWIFVSLILFALYTLLFVNSYWAG